MMFVRLLAALCKDPVLGKRVVPDGKMAVGAGNIAGCDEIAVGEEHRRLRLGCLDAGGVDRHHVGAIEEIGDAAEAFGLALRAVDRSGTIEAGELGIGGRIEHGLDLESKGTLWRLRDGQPIRGRDVLLGRKRRSIERDGAQNESPAVEFLVTGISSRGSNRATFPAHFSDSARYRFWKRQSGAG